MEKRKLTQIHLNPENPRLIKDEAFKRLVESIRSFPKMLEIKPIVIDDLGEILAGNQRYRACKELGMKEVPVLLASDLTEEQKQEFIVRDNTHYGEWDFNMLSTFHDAETLEAWGVPVWPSGDIEPIDLTSKENKEANHEENSCYYLNIEFLTESEAGFWYEKLKNENLKVKIVT